MRRIRANQPPMESGKSPRLRPSFHPFVWMRLVAVRRVNWNRSCGARTPPILEGSNFAEVVMMKWLTFSWKIGHVRGVEIRVHFSMLFSLVVAYYVFSPITLLRGLLVLLWLIGFTLTIFL